MIVQDSPITRSSTRRVLLYRSSAPSETVSSIQLGNAFASSFLFISSETDSEQRPKDSEQMSPLMSVSGYLKLSAFIYSLTNITTLAVPYILKDTLLLSPSQLGLFSAVCATPSFLKPIYSFLISRPHRPMAIVACSCIQASAFVTIGTAVTHGSTSLPIVLGCLLAHSFASSVGMFLRDSMTIELVAETNRNSQHEAHAIYAELSMIARVGLVPVSYLSGYLLGFITPAQIITSAAIFPAIIAVSACFLDTSPRTDYSVEKDEWKAAVSAIKDQETGLLSTVTGRSLALSVIPSYTDAMFFYYTDYLGFNSEFMGRFQFLGAIAGIVASGISKATVEYVDPRTVANIAQWVSIPLFSSILLVTKYPSMPYLGTFVLVRHFFVDFINSLTSLPAAMELMQSAPAGAEGTYLALVGTLGNVGGAINSVVSSISMNMLGISATNFDNLTTLVGITNGLSAISTPLVLFKEKPEVKTDAEELEQRGA